MSAAARALAAQQEQRRRRHVIDALQASHSRQAPALERADKRHGNQDAKTGRQAGSNPPAAGPSPNPAGPAVRSASERRVIAQLQRLYPTAMFLAMPSSRSAGGAPSWPAPPARSRTWRKSLPWGIRGPPPAAAPEGGGGGRSGDKTAGPALQPARASGSELERRQDGEAGGGGGGADRYAWGPLPSGGAGRDGSDDAVARRAALEQKWTEKQLVLSELEWIQSGKRLVEQQLSRSAAPAVAPPASPDAAATAAVAAAGCRASAPAPGAAAAEPGPSRGEAAQRPPGGSAGAAAIREVEEEKAQKLVDIFFSDLDTLLAALDTMRSRGWPFAPPRQQQVALAINAKVEAATRAVAEVRRRCEEASTPLAELARRGEEVTGRIVAAARADVRRLRVQTEKRGLVGLWGPADRIRRMGLQELRDELALFAPWLDSAIRQFEATLAEQDEEDEVEEEGEAGAGVESGGRRRRQRLSQVVDPRVLCWGLLLHITAAEEEQLAAARRRAGARAGGGVPGTVLQVLRCAVLGAFWLSGSAAARGALDPLPCALLGPLFPLSVIFSSNGSSSRPPRPSAGPAANGESPVSPSFMYDILCYGPTSLEVLFQTPAAAAAVGDPAAAAAAPLRSPSPLRFSPDHLEFMVTMSEGPPASLVALIAFTKLCAALASGERDPQVVRTLAMDVLGVERADLQQAAAAAAAAEAATGAARAAAAAAAQVAASRGQSHSQQRSGAVAGGAGAGGAEGGATAASTSSIGGNGGSRSAPEQLCDEAGRRRQRQQPEEVLRQLLGEAQRTRGRQQAGAVGAEGWRAGSERGLASSELENEEGAVPETETETEGVEEEEDGEVREEEEEGGAEEGGSSGDSSSADTEIQSQDRGPRRWAAAAAAAPAEEGGSSEAAEAATVYGLVHLYDCLWKVVEPEEAPHTTGAGVAMCREWLLALAGAGLLDVEYDSTTVQQLLDVLREAYEVAERAEWAVSGLEFESALQEAYGRRAGRHRFYAAARERWARSCPQQNELAQELLQVGTGVRPLRWFETAETLRPGLLTAHPKTWRRLLTLATKRGAETGGLAEAARWGLMGLALLAGEDLPLSLVRLSYCVATGFLYEHLVSCTPVDDLSVESELEGIAGEAMDLFMFAALVPSLRGVPPEEGWTSFGFDPADLLLPLDLNPDLGSLAPTHENRQIHMAILLEHSLNLFLTGSSNVGGALADCMRMARAGAATDPRVGRREVYDALLRQLAALAFEEAYLKDDSSSQAYGSAGEGRELDEQDKEGEEEEWNDVVDDPAAAAEADDEAPQRHARSRSPYLSRAPSGSVSGSSSFHSSAGPDGDSDGAAAGGDDGPTFYRLGPDTRVEELLPLLLPLAQLSAPTATAAATAAGGSSPASVQLSYMLLGPEYISLALLLLYVGSHVLSQKGGSRCLAFLPTANEHMAAAALDRTGAHSKVPLFPPPPGSPGVVLLAPLQVGVAPTQAGSDPAHQKGIPWNSVRQHSLIDERRVTVSSRWDKGLALVRQAMVGKRLGACWIRGQGPDGIQRALLMAAQVCSEMREKRLDVRVMVSDIIGLTEDRRWLIDYLRHLFTNMKILPSLLEQQQQRRQQQQPRRGSAGGRTPSNPPMDPTDMRLREFRNTAEDTLQTLLHVLRGGDGAGGGGDQQGGGGEGRGEGEQLTELRDELVVELRLVEVEWDRPEAPVLPLLASQGKRLMEEKMLR